MVEINRCICTNRTFASLINEAEEKGLSIDELARCTGASACCGMCRPYLEHALKTGEVVIDRILLPDGTEQSLRPAV